MVGMLVARRDVDTAVFRLFLPIPFMLAKHMVERDSKERCVEYCERAGVAEKRTLETKFLMWPPKRVKARLKDNGFAFQVPLMESRFFQSPP
jgi:hypothetical protein